MPPPLIVTVVIVGTAITKCNYESVVAYGHVDLTDSSWLSAWKHDKHVPSLVWYDMGESIHVLSN